MVWERITAPLGNSDTFTWETERNRLNSETTRPSQLRRAVSGAKGKQVVSYKRKPWSGAAEAEQEGAVPSPGLHHSWELSFLSRDLSLGNFKLGKYSV